jgi:hypothetical protein
MPKPNRHTSAPFSCAPICRTLIIARGDSYVLAGEYGRAIADYTHAAGIDPDNEAALAGLEQAQRGAQ